MTETTTLTHGGDWAGFAAEYGAAAPLLDFSANVSPLGMPAGVAAALAGCAPDCDCYPDPLCRDLRRPSAGPRGCRGNGCSAATARPI